MSRIVTWRGHIPLAAKLSCFLLALAVPAAAWAGAAAANTCAVDSGFPEPDSGTVRRETVKILDGEPPDAGSFSCELEEIECTESASRSIIYSTGKAESKLSLSLDMTILVKGPGGLTFLPLRDAWGGFAVKGPGGSFPSPHNGWGEFASRDRKTELKRGLFVEMLELPVAASGKSLDIRNGFARFNSASEPYFKNGHKNAGPDVIAAVTVSLRMRAASSMMRSPQTLSGVIEIPVLISEERVTLKPLSACMGKTVPLSNGASIVFKQIKDKDVIYQVRLASNPKKLAGLANEINIDYHTSSGEKLRSTFSGGSSSGNDSALDYQDYLWEPKDLATGGYAVVRVAMDMRVLEIPFEFKNVRIPSTDDAALRKARWDVPAEFSKPSEAGPAPQLPPRRAHPAPAVWE